MRKLIYLTASFCLLLSARSLADTTTGGVNWLDSLSYQKPAFMPITVPTPGANQYYVSLSSGSGSTCSQAAPCTLTTVSGKTGVNDGAGAYVYIKGSGAWDDVAITGSSGNEVVFKPWAAGTTGCATECTATITGRNNWSGPAKKFMIVDGGPDLHIQFVNSGANQFDPVVYFNSTSTNHHDITFYRTLWQVTNAGEWVAAFGGVNNLHFINVEAHASGATDSGNQHHFYISGCNGGVTIDGLQWLNNVIRDTPGESIELRAAGGAFSNVTISGNAFHDIGLGTCNQSWKCRSAITVVVDGTGCAGGGSFANSLTITNNLIWDTGEGAIRPWDMPSGALIANNTFYNWGIGTPANGAYSSAAFGNFSFTGTVPGTYQNNIFYATGNDGNGNAKVPFNANNSQGSFNACTSSQNCGTSKQTVASGAFSSLNENTSDFLKIVVGSTPVDTGTAICSATTDYFGTSRPQNGTCDIGAMEFGSSGGPPSSNGWRMRFQRRGLVSWVVALLALSDLAVR